MYKVETKTLERIKKHLRNVEKSLGIPGAGRPSYSEEEKIRKENTKLIKLIEENYYV